MNTIYDNTFVLGQTSATNFVAGPGIKIDEPSAGTVRIGNDETVLWSGSEKSGCNFSESCRNFDKLRVKFRTNDLYYYEHIVPTESTAFALMGYQCEETYTWLKMARYSLSDNQISAFKWNETTLQNNNSVKQSSNNQITLLEVRGINRISGNA